MFRPFNGTNGRTPHAEYLPFAWTYRNPACGECTATHFAFEERNRQRVREGDRGEVQPAASKFACNVTRPRSADEFAQIMGNKDGPHLRSHFVYVPRVMDAAAGQQRPPWRWPGPPVQPGENTELVDSDLPQSLQQSVSQAGRRAGRQQKAAVGRARKLKAVV